MSSNVSRQESPLFPSSGRRYADHHGDHSPLLSSASGEIAGSADEDSGDQKIMSGFDDEPRLRACGFEEPSADVESVLRSLRNSVSEEKAQQIDAIPELYAVFPDVSELAADDGESSGA